MFLPGDVIRNRSSDKVIVVQNLVENDNEVTLRGYPLKEDLTPYLQGEKKTYKYKSKPVTEEWALIGGWDAKKERAIIFKLLEGLM